MSDEEHRLPSVIVAPDLGDEDRNKAAQEAGERAKAAHRRIARSAKRLTEELDEITEVGRGPGIPIAELPSDDSLVIAVVALIEVGKPDDPDPVA